MVAAWMLDRMKKRKRIDSYELQALLNVVKKCGPTVIKDFEDVFQVVWMKGKRLKLFRAWALEGLVDLQEVEAL